ncbi:MAG: segregation/condensation protein A, partial [Atribacterota bacterium]|nr:segregation/condensation protein A [Atribacterota bacterium]
MNNKDIDFRININDFDNSINEVLKNVKEGILDIEQVPIVEIIEQYLKYVTQNKSIIDLSIAGKIVNEITIMLKMKSENLLPKLEVKSGEEEDDEDNDFMISKDKEAYLQEYEKYQKIVEYLKGREGAQNDIYFPMIESNDNDKEDGIEIERVDLADLLASLEKVLQNNKKKEFV